MAESAALVGYDAISLSFERPDIPQPRKRSNNAKRMNCRIEESIAGPALRSIASSADATIRTGSLSVPDQTHSVASPPRNLCVGSQEFGYRLSVKRRSSKLDPITSLSASAGQTVLKSPNQSLGYSGEGSSRENPGKLGMLALSTNGTF